MEFSRPKYWSGSPFPSPGDLPNPELESRLLQSRQILYHLSHQKSPFPSLALFNFLSFFFHFLFLHYFFLVTILSPKSCCHQSHPLQCFSHSPSDISTFTGHGCCLLPGFSPSVSPWPFLTCIFTHWRVLWALRVLGLSSGIAEIWTQIKAWPLAYLDSFQQIT